MGFTYSCVIGNFTFDDDGNFVSEVLNSIDDVDSFLNVTFDNSSLSSKQLDLAMSFLNSKKYLELFREFNLYIVKKRISESVSFDMKIIQVTNLIDEADKNSNNMVRRLREWFSLYFPELDDRVESNEAFVKYVLEFDFDFFLNKYDLSFSMGGTFSDLDVLEMKQFAKIINDLYEYKKNLHTYLDGLFAKYLPNLKAIAGTMIGAKLLESSGSLRRLVMFPSSTIQVLGAEKALFRHLKTGSRSPKYGHLFNHKYVLGVPARRKGKMARILAEKINLATKLDYFKSDYDIKLIVEKLDKVFNSMR